MIKPKDIIFVRRQVPDLDIMESFLIDFGLERSARTDTAVYMRGTGPNHHVYIAELGAEARLLGFGFEVTDATDLTKAAGIEGASAIEDNPDPGGGKRVRLTDPNGLQIEIVHGLQKLDALPVEPQQVNRGTEKTRHGKLVRLQPGPGKVKRLGHCVFVTPDFAATEAWYAENLGLLRSDAGYAEDPNEVVVAFLRCDQGDKHVDHHTLLPLKGPQLALHHTAFEVEDVNAVMLGHEYMRDKGHQHHWGIGRHIMGSQIFDYWHDPYGAQVEHWTDGDLLNADYQHTVSDMSVVLGSQWGPEAPPPPG